MSRYNGRYIVKRGDTLSEVAKNAYRKYNIGKVGEVAKDNHLRNPDLIKVGQTILLKGLEDTPVNRKKYPEIPMDVALRNQKSLKELSFDPQGNIPDSVKHFLEGKLLMKDAREESLVLSRYSELSEKLFRFKSLSASKKDKCKDIKKQIEFCLSVHQLKKPPESRLSEEKKYAKAKQDLEVANLDLTQMSESEFKKLDSKTRTAVIENFKKTHPLKSGQDGFETDKQHVLDAYFKAPYFKLSEIRSHHNGKFLINKESIEFFTLLSKFRKAVGEPLIIESGYRDKNHPLSKKNTESAHRTPQAADIRGNGSIKKMEWLMEKAFGFIDTQGKIKKFIGIGIYPDTKGKNIHLDLKRKRVNNFWIEKKRGDSSKEYIYANTKEEFDEKWEKYKKEHHLS